MGNERKLRAENPGRTVKRLMDYFSSYKLNLFLALGLWAIEPILRIVMIGMMQPIIASMLGKDIEALRNYLIVYAVVLIVRLSCLYIGQRLMMKLAQDVTYKLRKDTFSHMMDLPISYFDQNKKGNIMSTYTNDVFVVEQALSQSLPTILVSIITFFGSVIMMIALSWQLSILVLIFLLIVLIVAQLIVKISGSYYRKQQNRIADQTGYTEEMLNGLKVVKVFNHEEKTIEGFLKISEDLRVISTRAATLSVVLMPIMNNGSYFLYAAGAMLGASASIAGLVGVDVIITFLQYITIITQPITRLSNQANLIISAIAGAERIFNMLDETVEEDTGFVDITSDDSAERYWLIPQEDGTVERRLVEGHIEFTGVDFGYIPDKTILHGINLWAKPGQSIALVGSTGAGKTTITNLINRFYEIDAGRITYDGIDLVDIKKPALRSTLGMVLQDVHLFHGTVRNNIRYGRLGASDEEVEAAAKAANAHSFIVRLPDGYDTMLSTDGTNLSEGERQLISIARAAIARPNVLILDEATSSVDTRLEKLIELGMAKIREGRTTFSIAHRLSTVRNADAILVLEAGEIIERGDHDYLIRLEGHYYDLSTGKIELS